MELVNIFRNEPVIESYIIAKRLGIANNSLSKTLRKYQDRFENKGKLRFKIKPTASGQNMKFAYLNEEQAVFLLTLSRNTEKVVEFKDQLSKAFMTARQQLALRNDEKQFRSFATDSIKQLIEYAESNGSQNAQRYYTTFTTMINKALFGETKVDKDSLDKFQLLNVMNAESIVSKTIDNMLAENCDYHEVYKLAKSNVEAFAKVG